MNKPILIIDPGHGGKDAGGGTNQYWKEKDFTLQISLYQYERFKNLGIPVMLTRKEDNYLNSSERAMMVKESGAKYCISNHINAGGGEGVETIHSIFNNGKLAKRILDEIVQAGQRKRRVFSRALPNNPMRDYYYMHRQTGVVVTTIVEYGFADNKNDTRRLQQHWHEYAEAVVKGFCEYVGIKYSTKNKVAILGDSLAKKAQMKKYLLLINDSPKINCTIDELIGYYIEESRLEGIRGDIAFAQALKETGFFRYGGIVRPEQNNYCGIGAFNGNTPGQAATFPSPQIGVRAHIQHLKGYCSIVKPKKEIVDPRYEVLVKKKLLGTAPYVTDLNGKWAWPGTTYGQGILKILDQILEVKIDEVNCEAIVAEKTAEIERLKQENLMLKDRVNRAKEIFS